MSDTSKSPILYCCAYKGKEACKMRQKCFLFSEYFRISNERKLLEVNGFKDKAPYTIIKGEQNCTHFQSK